MHSYLLITFYDFDMKQVNVIFNVFMRLMKQKLPKLHQNFVALGLNPSIFLFEWVVAVWANIFPLKLSSRIWDQWLFYGEVFFWRAVLAICSLLAE